MAGAPVDSCTICFDDLAAVDIVQLPCDCKPSYCRHCWERALVDKMQCPTCRKYIDANYDAATRKPKFSITETPNHNQNLLTTRIREQAHNAQVALLQECVSGSSSDTMQCVCGDELKRISFDARRTKCNNRFPGFICDLCDGRINAANAAYLWTCSKGGDTVLHPFSYDVCMQCVQKHARQREKEKEEEEEEYHDCEEEDLFNIDLFA